MSIYRDDHDGPQDAIGPEGNALVGLSPEACALVQSSAKIAAWANQEFINTEHLLCAFVGPRRSELDSAFLPKVLPSLGLDACTLRAAILERITVGVEYSLHGRIPLTKAAERALAHAFEESRMNQTGPPGVGDLLVGLSLESEGVAAQVLRSLRVTTERLRDVLRTLRTLGV